MGAAEMKGNGQKHQPKVEACEAKSGQNVDLKPQLCSTLLRWLPDASCLSIARQSNLTLPCDAELVVKQHVTRDVEKALLLSMASSHCSTSSDLHHQVAVHQLPISGF
ncbi:hypothetical protein H0E87_013997 [Populus deltoides]|uniref:Uncharacterized protein n=1 Tax=Populus deltoides TaxID=3696 RepID=A0A8T2YBJ6_POPDE|nr:hypothetical protein H0E87_013997 [Populus deltoides]